MAQAWIDVIKLNRNLQFYVVFHIRMHVAQFLINLSCSLCLSIRFFFLLLHINKFMYEFVQIVYLLFHWIGNDKKTYFSFTSFRIWEAFRICSRYEYIPTNVYIHREYIHLISASNRQQAAQCSLYTVILNRFQCVENDNSDGEKQKKQN